MRAPLQPSRQSMNLRRVPSGAALDAISKAGARNAGGRIRRRLPGLAAATLGMIAAAVGPHGVAVTAARAAPPGGEPAAAQRRVVQAGGPVGQAGEVRQCGFGHHDAGRLCHGGCRDGGCPTHCPVRPQTFGFYGTQWRAWPTQGTAKTDDARGSMPVPPASSAVPGIDEESLKSTDQSLPADDLPVPDTFQDQAPPPALPADADRDARGPLGGAAAGRDELDDLPPLEPAPSKRTTEADRGAEADEAAPVPPAEGPSEPERALEPIRERPPEPQPQAEPPSKPDDNIFDEAGRSRRRSELLAVIRHRVAALPAPAGEPTAGSIGLASHPEPVRRDGAPDGVVNAGGSELLPPARGLRSRAGRSGGGNPLRPGRVPE